MNKLLNDLHGFLCLIEVMQDIPEKLKGLATHQKNKIEKFDEKEIEDEVNRIKENLESLRTPSRVTMKNSTLEEALNFADKLGIEYQRDLKKRFLPKEIRQDILNKMEIYNYFLYQNGRNVFSLPPE